MRNRLTMVALIVAGLGLSPVWAQDRGAQQDPHAGHGVASTEGPSTESGTAGGTPEHGADGAMDMGSMQGGSPPPDARNPHAYSDGYDFGPYKLHLADTHSLASLRVENLEAVHSDSNTFAAYDLEAWYGRTYNRAVVKAEGEVDAGELKDARTELLWGHALSAFWDAQLGVRFDNGQGPSRRWLAFGVQGLAPYWFDFEATAYLGAQGRSALRLNATYELLLTQKLILQPRIEANLYGKGDAGRDLGSGLSDVTAALRLRYEIRRELAPYIGVEWAGKLGGTRDLAQAAGEDPNETRLVAGLRFWF